MKKNLMEISNEILQMFIQCYESCPLNSKTPAKYMIFIKNFFLIVSKKRDSANNRLKNLKVTFMYVKI